MKTEFYDEIKLLHLLKAGDTDAYLQLYNKYHSALYAYILRFIKIPELAEDVLQEVFLKIWEIRERINPDLSFQAYLYRISRNSVFKLVKKIAADEELRNQVAYHISETIEDADLNLQWQRYHEILQAAIHQLPPQRQKIFKLCRQEGKKYEEVAAELNISRNTVKEHMVLAVKFLKDYVSRHADIQLIIALFFLK
ncbi:RNA polymerase sigma-70 factor [Chitinophagaceae bacterium LB-8]|jgi:RNA polymerase sigma-19 factor, ECF subfamily|uniref:RNA polymerase sigma factor n=1 Tax=Paraflavisolibacter caeni TaxID=2982496 RepID=A0A9X2Y0D0_9BACT|nr:RNA polymerase sigma-70 factor [Paraflavisolibacter caeni]MCU7552615.1 RNA polymerase sigma-70 factor [Paraflavisolibacter caeni]